MTKPVRLINKFTPSYYNISSSGGSIAGTVDKYTDLPYIETQEQLSTFLTDNLQHYKGSMVTPETVDEIEREANQLIYLLKQAGQYSPKLTLYKLQCTETHNPYNPIEWTYLIDE